MRKENYRTKRGESGGTHFDELERDCCQLSTGKQPGTKQSGRRRRAARRPGFEVSNFTSIIRDGFQNLTLGLGRAAPACGRLQAPGPRSGGFGFTPPLHTDATIRGYNPALPNPRNLLPGNRLLRNGIRELRRPNMLPSQGKTLREHQNDAKSTDQTIKSQIYVFDEQGKQPH